MSPEHTEKLAWLTFYISVFIMGAIMGGAL